MKKASIEDIYEVRQIGIVSDIDKLSLYDLYQPLIGVSSVGLYMSLIQDPSKGNSNTSTFENLSIRTGLTIGELFVAFESLEAVGLIKTFCSSNAKLNYFVFCLYSPLDPKEFFDDILFSGTLKKQLGTKAYELLAEKYSIKSTTSDLKNFEEVSTSFVSFFKPDFTSNEFIDSSTKKAVGRKKSKVKTGFDIVALDRYLSECAINPKDLNDQEHSIIEKFAALYSLDESQMSSLVSLSFDSINNYGERLNVKSLEKACRKMFGSAYRLDPKDISKGEKSNIDSESAISQKIKLMEEKSPAEWLAMLQGNHKPASADLKIVQDLAIETGLSFPVINALVDYVLTTNNNILSQRYVEKIGAALGREGIKTALDAMDYLNKNSGPSRYKKDDEQKKDDDKSVEEDIVSDEEISAKLEKLKKK